MSFFLFVFISDASKVSASDLENIQETETPPQSPTNLKNTSGGDKSSSLRIHMASPIKESTVRYTKNKYSVKESITEGTMSDTDSTPTHSSSSKKDQKKASKPSRFGRQQVRQTGNGKANESAHSTTSPPTSYTANLDKTVSKIAVNLRNVFIIFWFNFAYSTLSS